VASRDCKVESWSWYRGCGRCEALSESIFCCLRLCSRTKIFHSISTGKGFFATNKHIHTAYLNHLSSQFQLSIKIYICLFVHPTCHKNFDVFVCARQDEPIYNHPLIHADIFINIICRVYFPSQSQTLPLPQTRRIPPINPPLPLVMTKSESDYLQHQVVSHQCVDISI
jgi:hypothetical protein